MKLKKILSFLLAAAFVFSLMPVTARAASQFKTQSSFSGWDFSSIWYMAAGRPELRFSVTLEGTGSTKNPFQIGTADELRYFAVQYNRGAYEFGKAHVILTDDIDLGGVPWTPIGPNSDNPYQSSTFDGQGHTVSGLNVDLEGAVPYAGLFGVVGQGGVVKDLFVSGSVRVTSNYSGYGDVSVGGIAGLIDSEATIRDCAWTGTVTGEITIDRPIYVGGVVGMNGHSSANAVISRCSAAGSVTATNTVLDAAWAGGVAGFNFGSTVSDCWSTGAVTATYNGSADNRAGGVVGCNNRGTVRSCYHFEGALSAYGGHVGGVASVNDGTVTGCFWLAGTADRGVHLKGNSATTDVTELTAEQFGDRASFSGWDFDDVWTMGADRPLLKKNDVVQRIFTWEQLGTAMQKGGSILLCNDLRELGSAPVLVVPAGKTVILDLNGHTITRCLSQNVQTLDDGYLFRNDGTLMIRSILDVADLRYCGNTGNGGLIVNNGDLTVENVNFAGSHAQNGGAIWNAAGAALTLRNCVFGENSAAQNGGAVWNAGDLTLEDVTIKQTQAGGGVYNAAGSTLTVSGSISITGNTGGNVWLADGTVIRLAGPLSEDSRIGVVQEADNAVFTSGLPANGTLNNFRCDEAGVALLTDTATGEAKLIRRCTVTWKNYDGAVLDTATVDYGETPVYSGDTPTRDPDARYYYTFDKWTPDLAAATDNAVYTASYTRSLRPWYYDAATGTLTLLAGTYPADKWGGGVPEDEVLHVTAADGVVFAGDCSGLFAGFTSCTDIDLSNVDASAVTNVSGMFSGCGALTEVSGISGWDTGSVTDMSGMFEGCEALTALDLSGWSTDNVTDMSDMFDGCDAIEKLVLPPSMGVNGAMKLNNVEDGWVKQGDRDYTVISGQGEYAVIGAPQEITTCIWRSLAILPVYEYDFYDDRTLTLISGDFDGSMNDGAVTWGDSLYGDLVDCAEIRHVIALDGVTFSGDCSGLFAGFTSCRSMDLNGVYTAAVTDMSGMFRDCETVNPMLDLSDWNTEQVEDMSEMFKGCAYLESLDLSGWDIRSVFDGGMDGMFDGCGDLAELSLPAFMEVCEDMHLHNNGGLGWADKDWPDDPVSGDDPDYAVIYAQDWEMTYVWYTVSTEPIYGIDEGVLILESGVFDGSLNAGELWGDGDYCIDKKDITAVVAESGVILSGDCSGLFAGLRYCESIDLAEADLSGVTAAAAIFDGCYYLNTLALPADQGVTAAMKLNNSGGWVVEGETDPVSGVGTYAVIDAADYAETYTWRIPLTEPCYTFENGVLTLVSGVFDKDNNWGADVTASDVTSVAAKPGVIFSQDCAGLFADFVNCTSIDLSAVNIAYNWNVPASDISDMIEMNEMFAGCVSLTTLDLSGWNTYNVEDMYAVFEGCAALEKIVLPGHFAVDEDMYLTNGDWTVGGDNTRAVVSGDGEYAVIPAFTRVTVLIPLAKLEEAEAACTVSMGAAADSSKARADLYFDIPDGADAGDFTVTMNGVTTALDAQTPSANGFKVSLTVPAKNMGDKIAYSLNYNGTAVKSGEVSVADYAENLAQYYPEYSDFVDAMLAYGAAAQTYFNYDAMDLVSDADLTALAPVTGDRFDKDAIQADMNADATIPVRYTAMNVTFLADTTLSLAFRIKDGFTDEEALEWVNTFITLGGEAVSGTISVNTTNDMRFVIIR